MDHSRKLGDVKLSQVTFRATIRDRDTAKAKDSAGTKGMPVKPQQSDTKQPTSSISLKGLLTAQRITRELKNRAALRRKTRVRAQQRKAVTIINEQVPASSANPKQKFPYAQAKELIDEFLASRLRDVTYDPDTCASLTKDLCEEAKRIVRRLTPPRYKLICNMAIGSKHREDVTVTSQCLWDSHSDNVTSCSYENRTLFCVVLVYAVYFE
ncbi:dynein light chain Tctex-type protein 2B-like [Spea bombifrons]|uniref:dynein light chain Tctex-type protein 2B-like n=1 Tax=Spea bombifrons TaxID=233779 RepID=UPI00234B7DDD|nr:dynein light chain Tctex-type protein 2B-like [Spea bombifrons]